MLRQCSLKMLWITCCCGFLFFADIFSAASSSINAQTTSPSAVKKGILLVIEGAISPAVADYCVRGIKRANANGSQLIVLQMDTPGGLDKSMRNIIKEIIASRVPVVSYVAPSGARAASAGTYILSNAL